MRRRTSFLLVAFLMFLSLLLVYPISAQPIPTPATPQFTVRYVDYSYDVPPKYGIDQYTGQNITVQAGYHIDNRSIEFTIKNQQFTPYNDSSGHTIGMYYNFRYKGNYANDWTYYPLNQNGQSVIHYNAGLGNDEAMYPPIYPASNSDYTVILLRLSLLGPPIGSQEIPNGANVDFQIQGLIGYFTVNNNGYVILTGESSDWSSTQTVTIGNISSPTPISTITSTPLSSSSQSQSPTIPELSWLVIVPLLLAVFAVAFVVKHRKTDNLKQ